MVFVAKPLHWTLICAAVRHVERLPRGTDRTAAAVYYLRCVAKHLQLDDKFTPAYEAHALAARIETDGKVNPVWKELRSQFHHDTTTIPTQSTPDCNTGVSSPVLYDVEAYLARK